MKKNLCFFISFILLINYANAQKSLFGFTAGATFASYKAKLESVSVTSDTKVGFTAGVTMSSPLGKKFAFRPSLNFVQKGGKQTDEGSSDKTTFNYIELPLNFVYNAGTPKGMFFIGAGPSLSIGLSGKDKWKDGSESGSDDIKFGSGDDADLKSFEAGINVLAGYQFKGGFFVAANYDAGVNNIAPDDPQFNTKYHNRYFGIRIGCMFGGKTK
jgi:hypothetical protein